MAGPDRSSELVNLFEEEMARRPGGGSPLTEAVREPFLSLCEVIEGVVSSGGTIFLCGNGGSAAQAQHFAAELVGRFKRERDPMPAVALTVDTSALTALANDYGFESVFRHQARGLMKEGDLLIGLSTSGTSANVVRALEWAAGSGRRTAALTGEGGGDLARVAEICVAVPSTETDLIQEYHLVLLHIMAEVAEKAWTGNP